MKYITVREAAERLKLSKPRVNQFVSEGRLPAIRVGMQFLIDPADLDKIDRKPHGRPRNVEKPLKTRGKSTRKKVGKI